MILKNTNYWRIMEPILLGSVANILINYIFNPAHPDFILKEFVVKLEHKHPWTQHFGKRFFYQLLYLLSVLLLVLNVVGNLYIWWIADDFYSIKELLIINVSVFAISLLLTFLQWFVQFYKNWKHAEFNFQNSHEELSKLKLDLEKESNYIEFQKYNGIVKVHVEDIKYAISELGIVWVFYRDSKAVFNATLDKLLEYLPKHYFFKANRNMIIRKDIILSVTNSTYGKIDVLYKIGNNQNEKITISRLKASTFRKWYK